jgi:predicted DNA-binding transcriptional regulator AlpA
MDQACEVKTGRRFLTAPQLLERYGNRSQVWLWRILHSDPNFPRPVRIGRLRFFDEQELTDYEQSRRRDAEAETAEAGAT